jgi:hypothetical protein
MAAAVRERRRRGPVNRLRRLGYGALLACASGVAAADPLASFGAHRAVAAPPGTNSAPAARILEATLQGLLLVHAEEALDPAAGLQPVFYPRLALDRVNAHLLEPAVLPAPMVEMTVNTRSSLRDGLGFDVAVPELGNFHLNLYTRRNARTPGRRWSMNLSSGEVTEDAGRAWSLGGSLELVRTRDGARQAAFVPELMLDLGALSARPIAFSVSLKYTSFRSLHDKRALDAEVPQLGFTWRF